MDGCFVVFFAVAICFESRFVFQMELYVVLCLPLGRLGWLLLKKGDALDVQHEGFI